MYSKEGKIHQIKGNCIYSDMLTSKGQNGGALCFSGNGMIFGIYTDIIDDQNQNQKYSMCIRITDEITAWVDKF